MISFHIIFIASLVFSHWFSSFSPLSPRYWFLRFRIFAFFLPHFASFADYFIDDAFLRWYFFSAIEFHFHIFSLRCAYFIIFILYFLLRAFFSRLLRWGLQRFSRHFWFIFFSPFHDFSLFIYFIFIFMISFISFPFSFFIIFLPSYIFRDDALIISLPFLSSFFHIWFFFFNILLLSDFSYFYVSLLLFRFSFPVFISFSPAWYFDSLLSFSHFLSCLLHFASLCFAAHDRFLICLFSPFRYFFFFSIFRYWFFAFHYFRHFLFFFRFSYYFRYAARFFQHYHFWRFRLALRFFADAFFLSFFHFDYYFAYLIADIFAFFHLPRYYWVISFSFSSSFHYFFFFFFCLSYFFMIIFYFCLSRFRYFSMLSFKFFARYFRFMISYLPYASYAIFRHDSLPLYIFDILLAALRCFFIWFSLFRIFAFTLFIVFRFAILHAFASMIITFAPLERLSRISPFSSFDSGEGYYRYLRCRFPLLRYFFLFAFRVFPLRDDDFIFFDSLLSHYFTLIFSFRHDFSSDYFSFAIPRLLYLIFSSIFSSLCLISLIDFLILSLNILPFTLLLHLISRFSCFSFFAFAFHYISFHMIW